jgi:hypothetical protein
MDHKTCTAKSKILKKFISAVTAEGKARYCQIQKLSKCIKNKYQLHTMFMKMNSSVTKVQELSRKKNEI